MEKIYIKSEMLGALEGLKDFYIEDMGLISPIMGYLNVLPHICIDGEPAREIVKFIFDKDTDMYNIVFNNKVYINANDIALQALIKLPYYIYINEHLNITFNGYYVIINRDGERLECDIFDYMEKLSPEELVLFNDALNAHYKRYYVNSHTYIESMNRIY